MPLKVPDQVGLPEGGVDPPRTHWAGSHKQGSRSHSLHSSQQSPRYLGDETCYKEWTLSSSVFWAPLPFIKLSGQPLMYPHLGTVKALRAQGSQGLCCAVLKTDTTLVALFVPLDRRDPQDSP